jgi:hypothetical protein
MFSLVFGYLSLAGLSIVLSYRLSKVTDERDYWKDLGLQAESAFQQTRSMKLLVDKTSKENEVLSEALLDGKPHPEKIVEVEKIVYVDKIVEKFIDKDQEAFTSNEFHVFVEGFTNVSYSFLFQRVRNNFHRLSEEQFSNICSRFYDIKQDQNFLKLQEEWYIHRAKHKNSSL